MARDIVIDAIMMAAWHRFCDEHNLKPSMSRRGNCWDNAVAESRPDLFDYIEMFYNPKRRHTHLGGVSPEAFERASNDGL